MENLNIIKKFGIDPEVWETRILKRLGVDSDVEFSVLGEGSFGVAYDIGNNRVLKITHDPAEANSAFVLSKDKDSSPLKEAYFVYDVFVFPKHRQLFGIVSEKLYKADKLYLDLVMDFHNFLSTDEASLNGKRNPHSLSFLEKVELFCSSLYLKHMPWFRESGAIDWLRRLAEGLSARDIDNKD